MMNKKNLGIRRRILRGMLVATALSAMAWTGIGRTAPLPDPAPKAKAKKVTKGAPSKPAEKHSATKSSVQPVGNFRDPFKLPSPPVEVVAGTTGEMPGLGPMPPGPRGLIISQLKLEGIVRLGQNHPKLIAVLANSANRAYFLHENDALYNGVITKITPDSVYFREEIRDGAGKMSSREVIKKLAPESGEKK
jgi:Tfp pilus assembly protein PilP